MLRFALLIINRKLLLCSVTSPRIALAILAEQNAGFALLINDSIYGIVLQSDAIFC